MNTESILICFMKFKFLAKIEYFEKPIAHAKALAFAMADFQHCLISGMFGFF